MQLPEQLFIFNINKNFNISDLNRYLKSFQYENNKNFLILFDFDHYTSIDVQFIVNIINPFLKFKNSSNGLLIGLDIDNKNLNANDWHEIDKINHLMNSAKTKLYFIENGLFDYYETRNAYYKLEKIMQSIDTNGYSPLEKLMAYYLHVTKYKEKFENDSSQRVYSRAFCGVLNSGYIMCAGYASMLEKLCNFENNPNLKCIKNFCYYKNKFHVNNFVYINDEKYGVKGIYQMDPTFDSHFATLGFFMSTFKNASSRTKNFNSFFYTDNEYDLYPQDKKIQVLKSFLPNEENKTLNTNNQEFMNFFIKKTSKEYKEKCSDIISKNVTQIEKDNLLKKLKSKYENLNNMFRTIDETTELEYYRDKLKTIANSSAVLKYGAICNALRVVVTPKADTNVLNNEYFAILAKSINMANPELVGLENCFYEKYKESEDLNKRLEAKHADDENIN